MRSSRVGFAPGMIKGTPPISSRSGVEKKGDVGGEMIDGVYQATLLDYQVVQVSLLSFNSTGQAARTCADNDDILHLGIRDHGIESTLSNSLIESPHAASLKSI